MYLEHFGLSEAPFRITPHTEFFFAGANRGATLDALLYAVTHDEGIVKVSGEVGSGKTMLCRVLMERLPPHVVIVYLANPSLSRDDILFAIADELEIGIPEGSRTSAVLRALQTKLIELYAQGRQVVVLIDEAHAMPQETLEEIRLLSNLESNRHKLLQLVLFGQPELNEILARSDMRQLKERITHNFNLEPLRRDDIAQYLDFRMRAAGYRGPEIFSPAAVKRIAEASLGLTRRINILADKSLLAAFAENGHQVTPVLVNAAVRDSEFSRGRPGLGRLALALGGAGAVAGVAILLMAGRPSGEAAPSTPATPTLPISQPAAPMPSPQAPAAPTPAATPEPAAAPAPTAQPAAPTDPAPANTADADLGPLIRVRLDNTRKWLASAADDRWFVQLLATDARQKDDAERFVAKALRLLPPEQVRVYTAERDGERRLGVIYGDFANREETGRAIDQLPGELRAYHPFPRQVRRLR